MLYECDLTLLLLKEWLKFYSRRRYGKAVHQVEAAWDILHHTIYNCTDGIAVCLSLSYYVYCNHLILTVILGIH